MRILIIMQGYFPGKKYGGPPVSISNFCALLPQYECYIITTNHDFGDNKPYEGILRGWNELNGAKVMYLTKKEFNIHSIIRVAKEISPDLVYLQSLFSHKCILPGLLIAKKMHIPVILAPRGELCGEAFKKKYKKIPYIIALHLFGLLKRVIFQSTSKEETEAICRFLKCDLERVGQLANIPSIPNSKIIHPTKVEGIINLVFISRIVRKKNLHSALEYLTNVKEKVIFNIYGPKENLEYWQYCEQIISRLPANISVNYCGILSHDEVSQVFSSHDAFLFPTFSENYGHVIAEALLSGCIPIISDQTPWNDIESNGAGWAISLSDSAKFISTIKEVAKLDEAGISVYRDNIRNYIGKKMNLEELKNSYDNFISKVVINQQ